MHGWREGGEKGDESFGNRTSVAILAQVVAVVAVANHGQHPCPHNEVGKLQKAMAGIEGHAW